MDKKTTDKYIPMTETAYYILLSLQEPLHGYGIILSVERLTGGRIRIGAGTIYGTLAKLEEDGLIQAIREENRRKIYVQTASGRELLSIEIERLRQLLRHGDEWRDRNG